MGDGLYRLSPWEDLDHQGKGSPGMPVKDWLDYTCPLVWDFLLLFIHLFFFLFLSCLIYWDNKSEKYHGASWWSTHLRSCPPSPSLDQIIPTELPKSSFPCQFGQFWATPVIPWPISSSCVLLSLFWCCLMTLLSSFLWLLDRISCSPMTAFIRAGDRLCHVNLT